MNAGASFPDVAIGLAGWSYPDWDGIVYERGVKDRLGYLAPYVDMLEINRTTGKKVPVPPPLLIKHPILRTIADAPVELF